MAPFFTDTKAWEQRELEEVITVGNGMDYKHLSEGGIPVYGMICTQNPGHNKIA